MTDLARSPVEGFGRRALAALLRPVDGAGLAAFRILYGAVMFGAMVRLVTSGWIGPLFAQPSFHFKYPGFEWVPGWPEAWMYSVHAGVLAVLALCVALGLFYRASIVLFTVGFAWLELVDVTNYLNHYYLVVLLGVLMSALPLHRVWSLDARRKPQLRAQTLPAWALYLLRFQVGAVYVHAGLAKFGSDWLLHAQPLGIWLAARTETPVIGPLLDEPWVAYALSWAGFLFDTTVVLWLCWARTRPFAYAVVLVFHFFTGVFFNIGIFPVLMVTCALIFFPPEWPRRLLKKLAAPAPPVNAEVPTWTAARRVGFALMAAWCLFHAVVPLRHYLYPGDVIWNEEGMRWSWKVMLREKNGSVTYRGRDPQSGREWHVSPAEYLTPRQMKEMSGQPDLILQLGQHLGRQLRARGIPDAEIRVDAWASLNGRRAQRLIDPEVDLMDVRLGLSRAEWILPDPEGPPLSPFASSKAPSRWAVAP